VVAPEPVFPEQGLVETVRLGQEGHVSRVVKDLARASNVGDGF
jgi:hypothetical protein